MQRPRARRAALASGLALLMGGTALTSSGPAHAQAQPAPQPQPAPAPPPALPAQAPAPPPPQVGVAQRILVRGNERIEPATVISYLPIQRASRSTPPRSTWR